MKTSTKEREIFIGTIQFTDIKLSPKEITSFRGFIANKLKEYDLVHNHNVDTGQCIYRYPLIQFKLINNIPTILALNKSAINIFIKEILSLQNINLNGKRIELNQKNFRVEREKISYLNYMKSYTFRSPWLALNEKNWDRYIRTGNNFKRRNLLEKILISNVLSACKGLNIFLDSDEVLWTKITNVIEEKVTLKGIVLTAFFCDFLLNFSLPEWIGLGKQPSRGFGIIEGVEL